MKDVNLSVWKYIHIYAICGNNVYYYYIFLWIYICIYVYTICGNSVVYYYIFLKDAKIFLTVKTVAIFQLWLRLSS